MTPKITLANDMELRVLTFLRKHPAATFAQLRDGIPGFAEKVRPDEMTTAWLLSHPKAANMALWTGLTEEGQQALEALQGRNLIRIKACSDGELSYSFDGGLLPFPIARKLATTKPCTGFHASWKPSNQLSFMPS